MRSIDRCLNRLEVSRVMRRLQPRQTFPAKECALLGLLLLARSLAQILDRLDDTRNEKGADFGAN